MDGIDALARSEAEVLARVEQLAPEHWAIPNVCGEWSVDDLVRHLVVGSRAAVTGLTGAPVEHVVESMQSPIDGDLRAALRASLAEQAASMRTPGALAATVHYPMIDMSGARLLGFRVLDLTLHAWDLARALGFDERLDADLVEWAWHWLQPMAPHMAAIGMFGQGASGALGEADPLACRLIDLTGRRP